MNKFNGKILLLFFKYYFFWLFIYLYVYNKFYYLLVIGVCLKFMLVILFVKYVYIVNDFYLGNVILKMIEK